MLTNYVRILGRGLRVSLSTPVLWLAVLLESLPEPPGRSLAWFPSCVISLMLLPASFVGMVAVPYAVFRAEKGMRPSLSDTWNATRKALVRYAGLVAIVAIPGLSAFLIGQSIFDKGLPAIVVMTAAVVGKYVVLPIAGVAITFAAAGVVLRGLNAFRALSEGFSLLARNFVLASLVGISLSVLMLIPQGALLATQGGAEAAFRALTSFRAIAANPGGGIELMKWYLIQPVVYLPFVVYQWSVFVELYISASERIAPSRLTIKPAA